MTEAEIKNALLLIQDEDILKGSQEVKKLLYSSREGKEVYSFYKEILKLLSSKNDTTRTRAILLIAHNAKHDDKKLLDEVLDEYLSHLYDEGNETAEHCIRSLVWIAKAKPYLKERFIKELTNYDLSKISNENREVIKKNLEDSLKELNKLD